MAGKLKNYFKGFMGKLGLSKRKGPFFPELFSHFQDLIAQNNRSLEIMTDMGEKLSGEFVFDQQYIRSSVKDILESVYKMIYHLDCMTPNTYKALFKVYKRIKYELNQELEGNIVIPAGHFIIDYPEIDDTLETLVGGKNVNLGITGNILKLNIPRGFAITSRCFDYLIRSDPLGDEIRELLERWHDRDMGTVEVSKKIREKIMEIKLPRRITKAIEQGVSNLKTRNRLGDKISFAVRSSCVGEDSEHSFAGLYKTLLNVQTNEIPEAYKTVVASMYSPRAMEYRRKKNISESEVIMAAGCQVMVEAKASGVVYTLDAFNLDDDRMLIASLPGLGADLVSGRQEADCFYVSRISPHKVIGMDIAHKEDMLVHRINGSGTRKIKTDEVFRDCPTLSSGQIREIAEAAMALEKFFRHPQDIEFAIDPNGCLIILQARPLNIEGGRRPDMVYDISEMARDFPVIMELKGEIVQAGVAMGKVFIVKDESDLENIPKGSILVAHFSSPNLAQAMRKIDGIITDIGSPIGHLATISREFRIPMIVNTNNATKILEHGRKITMDAIENIIYDGFVKELCYYEFTKKPFEESYEYRLLRRLFKTISPLYLVNPNHKNFSPESCRTLHDLTRFVHEAGVNILVNMNYTNDPYMKNFSKKLELDVPLDLTVIDFDICDLEKDGELTLDQIICLPLKKFAQGVCAPGLWAREPVSVDFKSFMSSMTRTFSSNVADPRFVGQNLAVVSGDYANISLRLGYHYSMINTIASAKPAENYVYFRFFGGVTDKNRRSRRARLISKILSANDFMISRKGDLVVGRIKGARQEIILDKVFILGALVSFTRQLDVKMDDDLKIKHFADEFQESLVNLKENIK